MNAQMWRTWGTRGVFAVLDQGLFSTTNFVLNVLLARWLLPPQYGAFAVALASFLVLLSVHQALILEPVSMLGPARFANDLVGFARKEFTLHWRLTTAMGGALVVAGALAALSGAKGKELGAVLAAAGFATPFMLLLWLVRRILYVHARTDVAAATSLAYAVAVISATLLLVRISRISAPGALLSMAAGSVLASGVMLLWPGPWSSASGPAQVLPELVREQWRVGRWMLAWSVFPFFTGQLQTYMVASAGGLEAAGALRALQNVAAPGLQTMVALSTLVLPALSFDFGLGRTGQFRKKSLVFLFAMVVIAAAYAFGLAAAAGLVHFLLYGSHFVEVMPLIPLMGVAIILYAPITWFTVVLRGLGRPRIFMWLAASTAIVGSISSVGLVPRFGLAGAVWSIVITTFGGLLAGWMWYRRERAED